ncbi:MAG: hypothetical protein RL026_1165 [Pseudomonadota bacterium]
MSIIECQLVLAFPSNLEEDVIGFLHGEPTLARGFTLVAAEGFGQGAALDSAMEQIRGRARRRLVLLLMSRADARQLLERLARALKGSRISWWLQPIEDSGKLA